MPGSKERSRSFLLAALLLALACDPYFSIKRTVISEGEVTEACIQAAAESLENVVSVNEFGHSYGPEEIEGFIVSAASAEIEVVWPRDDPRRLEIGMSGIGHTNPARDEAICGLVRGFYAAFLERCALSPAEVSYQDELIRSKCSQKD